MSEVLQSSEPEKKAERFSLATLLIGAVVLLAIGVSVWFLLETPGGFENDRNPSTFADKNDAIRACVRE